MLLLALTLLSRPALAQGEHSTGTEESAEAEYHPNHFGGLLAVSKRSGDDEAAPTLGLEYTRQFSPHWGVTGYIELVSSELERDLIVTVGAAYYPIAHLAFVLAVGGELAEVDAVHQGVPTTETELALLVRTGVTYGFRITPEASIGPSLLVDFVDDRVTFVLGLAFVVGF